MSNSPYLAQSLNQRSSVTAQLLKIGCSAGFLKIPYQSVQKDLVSSCFQPSCMQSKNYSVAQGIFFSRVEFTQFRNDLGSERDPIMVGGRVRGCGCGWEIIRYPVVYG